MCTVHHKNKQNPPFQNNCDFIPKILKMEEKEINKLMKQSVEKVGGHNYLIYYHSL